ncbi:MAG: SRPBCC family protein [Caulobacterales bacterium]
MDFNATAEQRMDLEAARTAPPKGFPALPEIPAARYTSEAFHKLELEHVLRKTWMCIGRDNDVGAAPGSYITFRKLGAPILIVRGRDGVLRAFYNTCRHRGAPVVRDECGQTSMLRCQYHSWSYGLDGKLISVPDAHDFACLDKDKRGLLPIRCDTWAGLLFINEDMHGPSLIEHLGVIPNDLACVGMEKLRTVEKQSYILECNWKAAMDAFVETYHLNTIHPEVRNMLDAPANAIELLPNGHSRQAMRKALQPGGNWNTMDGAPDIPEMPELYRRNTITYTIFPNIVSPMEAIGVPMLLFFPIGHNRCEMQAMFMGPDWGDAARPQFWGDFLKPYTKVLLQDQENLAPIQESMNCGALSGVMVNYQERRIYWHHEEIDRRIGWTNIPQGLAVARVLDDFVEEPFESIAQRVA